tara:strand:+ start:266 stop:457 length:192 start_codon:yes stop_codon:yes gene_type:complete
MINQPAMGGGCIEAAIRMAIETADSEQDDVTFDFNGAPIIVATGSDFADVMRRWEKNRCSSNE